VNTGFPQKIMRKQISQSAMALKAIELWRMIRKSLFALGYISVQPPHPN
jgi:hypothetical protein